jgi:hypothetical protein
MKSVRIYSEITMIMILNIVRMHEAFIYMPWLPCGAAHSHHKHVICGA